MQLKKVKTNMNEANVQDICDSPETCLLSLIISQKTR